MTGEGRRERNEGEGGKEGRREGRGEENRIGWAERMGEKNEGEKWKERWMDGWERKEVSGCHEGNGEEEQNVLEGGRRGIRRRCWKEMESGEGEWKEKREMCQPTYTLSSEQPSYCVRDKNIHRNWK